MYKTFGMHVPFMAFKSLKRIEEAIALLMVLRYRNYDVFIRTFGQSFLVVC